MPRKPRLFVPGYAAHIVQRGNNRAPTFFEPEDYQVYLFHLVEAANRYGCQIHAYVLMTNHVHLLATPHESDSLSRMMQCLGRHFVPFINHKYQRSGTLWEGRFKACSVASTGHVLACYRYIEMNPVRAGMVSAPGEYRWSSFRANVGEVTANLLTEHVVFADLGPTRDDRINGYLKLFDDKVNDDQLKDLRACLQSGTPYCNERFKVEIEAALKTKLGHKRRGRPRRNGNKGL